MRLASASSVSRVTRAERTSTLAAEAAVPLALDTQDDTPLHFLTPRRQQSWQNPRERLRASSSPCPPLAVAPTVTRAPVVRAPASSLPPAAAVAATDAARVWLSDVAAVVLAVVDLHFHSRSSLRTRALRATTPTTADSLMSSAAAAQATAEAHRATSRATGGSLRTTLLSNLPRKTRPRTWATST